MMRVSVGWKSALIRGFCGRCPCCKGSRLFRSYIKPVDACAVCGTSWGAFRADDFPPYIVLLITGFVFVPLFLVGERLRVPMAVELAVGLPLVAAVSVALLPRCKGAIIGLMWSLGLTGNEGT